MTTGERMALDLVDQGVIRVDEQGGIWRLMEHQGDRLDRGKITWKTCAPRRCDRILPNGYRQFKFRWGGKQHHIQAHRLVYLATHRTIDDNLEVDHVDFNPLNNRPDNLQQLTGKRNKQRSRDVGRMEPIRRFTENQIRDIRAREDTGVAMAKEYGCSKANISLIRNRHIYAWVQ